MIYTNTKNNYLLNPSISLNSSSGNSKNLFISVVETLAKKYDIPCFYSRTVKRRKHATKRDDHLLREDARDLPVGTGRLHEVRAVQVGSP